jgi:cytochrome P450 family 110
VTLTHSKLPPGPRFALLQTARLVRNPYRLYADCQAQYGRTFSLPAMNGIVVCTGDPEGVREIYTADPDTFGPFAVKALVPVLGPGSVVAVGGAEHRAERKRLAPSFQGARMRAYGELMRAAARKHARAWRDGRVFRMQDTTQAISLEIILRAVFGVAEDALVSRFEERVTRFTAAMSPLVLFTKALQHDFLGIGPWARFQRARAEYDELLLAQIRSTRKRVEHGDVGLDILSQLLAVRGESGEATSDEHVRDALVTLLFAGHETTALAIAWVFYWTHRDPAVLARLRAEVDPHRDSDAETVAALPYLDAVCCEALRLHAIAPDGPRAVVKPFTLRGFTVPPGCGVAAIASLVHDDPSIFPDPSVYRPERFLERTFKPWEWFPFGGGARRCPGAAFALYEMKLVVAALIAENALELCEPAPVLPVRRSLTLGPSTGVRMRFVERR